MGETTGITWTDHTFNPWIGCTAVSAECDNCYAWDLSEFRGWAEWGRGKARHLTKTWPNPPKFNRKVERGDPFTSEWLPPVREGTRRRLVFCASLADVFDAEVPADYRQQLWQLIRKTPNLDWQLLTKRPNLIKRMLPPDLVNAPNIWLGTSVGMQATTWRIPKLLETPAVVHFLSIEPLLGPIPNLPLEGIEWVIVGGESGEGVCSTPEELERRRLVYLDGDMWKPKPTREVWVREIRDQCVAARVPLFFKQWGGPKPTSGGHGLDGREWRQFPVPGNGGDIPMKKPKKNPAAVVLGRLGGSKSTPAKTKAARANARKRWAMERRKEAQ